jgi:hypothetical protein
MKPYNERIEEIGNAIIKKLLQKNTAYGNSVFKPVKLFGDEIKASVAVKARISDKLTRIQNKGFSDETEDTLDDLIGYFILLKIINEDEKTEETELHYVYEENVRRVAMEESNDFDIYW